MGPIVKNESHFKIWVHCAKWVSLKSKETYGQTRGLSNLEMKHVGKLAIIGALLKNKLG